MKAAALALALAVIVAGCGKDDAATIERKTMSVVSTQCRAAILRTLRDPESVVFESDAPSRQGSGFLVAVTLRAKNGFGGYNRTSMVCVVDSAGTVTAVIPAP